MDNLEDSGCKKTEECIREGDENSKCNCLIDEDDRATDESGQLVCECEVGIFFDGQCVPACESSDDCNGEKCVKRTPFRMKSVARGPYSGRLL